MVGKKIRAFREFRGYSQIQLAELNPDPVKWNLSSTSYYS